MNCPLILKKKTTLFCFQSGMYLSISKGIFLFCDMNIIKL